MRRRGVASALCVLLFCTLALAVVKASAPFLQTTQDTYCGAYDPGWGIAGTSDDRSTRLCTVSTSGTGRAGC